VDPRLVVPAVGIIGQPRAAAEVLLEHEDMVPADSGHARGRRGPREAEPVGRQPKIPHLVPKYVERRAAPTERRVRAPCGVLDDLGGALGARGVAVVIMVVGVMAVPRLGGRDEHQEARGG